MAIIFAATEDIAYYQISGGAAPSTLASDFDPAYSRYGMAVDNSGQLIRARFDSTSDHIYISWRYRTANATSTNNDNTAFELRSGTTAVFRIRPQDGVWSAYTIDGGAETNGQLLLPNMITGIWRFTVRFHLSVSGGFDVWKDNDLVASFSGDTIGGNGVTFVDDIRFSGTRSQQTTAAISEVIVATHPQTTINMRLMTLVPNGDGNQVDWTNGFANVDENTNSLLDTIDSDTANDVELMDVSAYGGNADFAVVTVGVMANALKGATGPQNFQFASRHGTTDGFSGNKTILETYDVLRHNFDLNPDTGVAWTIADLAAAQFGVKSIT